MTYTGLVICLVLLALCFVSFIIYVTNDNIKREKEVEKLKKDLETLLSQKKSGEVRLGKTAEHLAPLVNWPHNPEHAHFLGSPVDFLQYNLDGDKGEILFIEIKTGGARLSKSQKQIRDIIRAGRVYFATYRLSADGIKFTKLTNEQEDEAEETCQKS
jgi:predicted Holliday junction resolvase-like endonuclease